MVRKSMKKLLAAVLVSAMVLGCVPSSAFPVVAAAETVSEPVAQSELQVAFDQEYAAVGHDLSVTVTGGSNVTYAWYIGGKQIDNTTNSYMPKESDVENWIEVVVTSGTATASTKMYFSYLPVVYIDTEGGQAITSKENYIDANLKIQGNEEYNSETTKLYDGLTEIRGRGNSTWSQPKKPYRLKLDKKTDLFGMGKSKHWVLLANYMDESLMRNTYAYDLSGEMGMEHMSTVWVSVVMNGEYAGNYQLCENIRADENRVDVFDWEGFGEDAAAIIAEAEGMDDDTAGDLETYMVETNMGWITSGNVAFNGKVYKISDYPDIEVPDITGGYILELDEYYDEVSKFKTASGQPIMFKNPEFVNTNSDMMNYVKTYVQAFEDAVQSDSYTADYNGVETHYSELYDFDSLVDYWLICEIFFQEEINKKSTYMYKEIDELMKMGPIWDMDWSSGGEGDTQHTDKWATLHFNANAQSKQWYKYLVQDPYFLMKVQERYWEIRYVQLQDMLDRFDGDIAYLKESGEADGDRWGFGQSYEYYANHFKTWMNTHVAWMDTQMATEDSFDGVFYKANDDIQIMLADYNGEELKGDIALKASADYTVGLDENIVVFVTGTDAVEGDACVYVNSILVAEIPVGEEMSVVEIDASTLTADAGEKNVIEVKTATASNYVTVKEKEIGGESDVDKTALETLIYEAAEKEVSKYSAKSWAVFKEAYENACIIAINPSSTKEEVDAAKDALQEAMDALVEVRDPADASDDYDVTKITYSAGSAQAGEGIELAFDGNEDTIWHTQYSNPRPDWYGTEDALNYFWVLFELEEPTIIEALRYLPRNNNGDIKSYKIEGSKDGENWYTLAEGDWEYSSVVWQSAEFDAVEVSYIRLWATATVSSSGSNRHVSARELRLRTAEEEVTPLPTPTPDVPKVELRAFDSAVLAENAKANSEQLPAAYVNDGGAAWAFDGDTTHWWHSRYDNWDQKSEWEIGSAAGDGKPAEDNQIWIQTGFDQVWYVDSITYLPRDNGHGVIRDYTVSVANLADPTADPTDEDFTVVKTGTLEPTVDMQTIQLDEAVAATHVRITVASSYMKGDADGVDGDGHVAARDIKIYGYDSDPAAVDKTALEAKVAAYAAVDTSVYTDETAAAFADALAAAQAVLAKEDATQEEVNAAQASLEAAYAALEEKVDTEPENIIPVSEMKATAGNEELVNSDISVEGPASLAIDEDESTIWHTDWYVGPDYDDHWLQLELNTAYMVDSFRYLPRQNGNTNGMITSYKILVSMDGQEWTEVAEGNWDAVNRDWKVAEFDTVKAKYVRLKVEGSESDIGICLSSAAEVRLTGTIVECEEHNVELVGKKDATCMENGFTGNEACTICGKVIKAGEVIAATGHEWSDWTVTEATCTEDGSKQRTCSVCGEIETEVIPATGHQSGEWEVVKEATCTEAGSKEAVCEVCGEKATEEIPALGHTWGEWEVVTEPTEKEKGLQKHTCSVCGETEEEEIPALNDGWTNPFIDVAETDWYYKAVAWGSRNKVVAGLTEDMFYPAASCTRAQIVSFIWRAEGRPEPAAEECAFTDIAEGNWYYDAVLWATENGIVYGYTDELFAPDATCTRAEMATFIWRLEGKHAPEGTENPFIDVDGSQWYASAAQWTYENGIVSGYDLEEGKAFAPTNTIARAETVTMLYRYYGK